MSLFSPVSSAVALKQETMWDFVMINFIVVRPWQTNDMLSHPWNVVMCLSHAQTHKQDPFRKQEQLNHIF